MKRFSVLVIVMALVLGGVSAQDSGPLMDAGDLAVSAGVGYGFLWGAIDVSAGAEMMLGRFVIGETIPLTYGAAVKGVYYRYSYNTDWYYSYLGAGVFGTLHVSLKDVPGLADNDFLEKIDTYIGLGLGIYGYNESYYSTDTPDFKLGLRSAGGVNYFLTDNLAINVEGGYYGGWGGGMIGVLFKL